MITQELTLVSYLLKNLVERADRDQDGEVTIEEILTFDDFEFIESAFPAVLELGNNGGSLNYLVGSKIITFHLKFAIKYICVNELFHY